LYELHVAWFKEIRLSKDLYWHGEIVSDSSSGDLLARIVNKESKLFSEFLSSHLTLLHRCVSNDKKWWDIGLLVRKRRKGQTDMK